MRFYAHVGLAHICPRISSLRMGSSSHMVIACLCPIISRLPLSYPQCLHHVLYCVSLLTRFLLLDICEISSKAALIYTSRASLRHHASLFLPPTLWLFSLAQTSNIGRRSTYCSTAAGVNHILSNLHLACFPVIFHRNRVCHFQFSLHCSRQDPRLQYE